MKDVDGGATDMGFGEGKDDDNDGSAAASDGDSQRATWLMHVRNCTSCV